MLEQKATKLAASLGVGKLNDQKLVTALRGFFLEGIRFAFSNDEEEEDEFLLGSRLLYLRLQSKFLGFVKKRKKLMKEIGDLFLEKEEELKSDPDFSEIRPEDMEAVDIFARGLGLARKPPKKAKRAAATPIADEEEEEEEEDETSFVSPLPRSSNKRRISQASMGSVRSARSNTSNLSPLYEDESEDDDLPIQTLKRRKSTPQPPKEQGTIKEGSDEDEDSVSSGSASS